MIGVGQRVQILLSGLDLRVPHPVHHTLEVSAAREKPRSVRVAEIVHPDAEVDARCFDSRQPDSGAERVPRDRSALAGREQQVVGIQPSDADPVGELVDEVGGDALFRASLSRQGPTRARPSVWR